VARHEPRVVKRDELEHVIRAAAAIAGDDELIIVGSQSVLGQFPDAPPELLVSVEVDIYPKHHPERADLIDGSIGELSPFHETFGYYAQGVGTNTAVVPAGWESRLVPVKTPATRGATGWCLEIHDLVLSKYVAAREKDHEFIAAAIEHRLVERAELEHRLPGLPVDDARRAQITARIAADFS
jgi:hypothetical protein